MVGDAELVAMRRVVTAMRNSDGTFLKETVKLTGSFSGGGVDGSQVGLLEGLLSIGAFNITTAQNRAQPVLNETEFEIQEVHLVGGSDVGADVRIPCILDAICTEAVASADAATSFTFAAIYTLNVPSSSLPCAVTVDVSGVQFAVEDNTRQQFIRAGLKTSQTFRFDSRIDSSASGTPYEVLVTLNIDDGTRARDVMRSIGGLDYRMYLHGDTALNGLGKLWKSSDSVHFEIDGETSNPNAEENVPTWYLPLHEENTWNIRASSSNDVRFRMNFPLNWPLPFPLHVVQPSMWSRTRASENLWLPLHRPRRAPCPTIPTALRGQICTCEKMKRTKPNACGYACCPRRTEVRRTVIQGIRTWIGPSVPLGKLLPS